MKIPNTYNTKGDMVVGSSIFLLCAITTNILPLSGAVFSHKQKYSWSFSVFVLLQLKLSVSKSISFHLTHYTELRRLCFLVEMILAVIVINNNPVKDID